MRKNTAPKPKQIEMSEATFDYLTSSSVGQFPEPLRRKIMMLVEDVIGHAWEIDELPEPERLAAYEQLEHFAGGRADDLRRKLSTKAA